MKEYYDITTVCKQVDTTSRTLRFYEEQGLIDNVTFSSSQRRQYTPEQIKHIREILVLRTLGLSIADIREILRNNGTLSEYIRRHRAEMIAKISKNVREIRRLDHALQIIEDGGDIFDQPDSPSAPPTAFVQLAEQITQEFLIGDYRSVFDRFTDQLQAYLPFSALLITIKDVLEPLGPIITLESITVDSDIPSIVHSRIRCRYLGLSIKWVFHQAQINGIWFSYYNNTEEWK